MGGRGVPSPPEALSSYQGSPKCISEMASLCNAKWTSIFKKQLEKNGKIFTCVEYTGIY